MTAPSLAPDPTRCPACRAPLPAGGSCPACGLLLRGPLANRLWDVDCELLRLDHTRAGLLTERAGLLTALRTGAGAPAPAPETAPDGAAPAREWTPQRVQNLLLALGGLLLAVAAVVFTAVTYERLGATGRAGVLAVLTATAAVAAPRLRARGLSATSEAVGAVALVLAALDAYGLRTLGLAQDSHPLSYAAASAAVLAAVTALYARFVPLRVLQVAAVVLSQLSVLLLLGRTEPTAAVAGLALAALAAADLAVLAADRSRPALPRAARRALWTATAGVTAVALQASLGGALLTSPELGALALLACAAVLAAAGALRSGVGRALLTGTAVPVLATAAYALTRHDEVVVVLVLAAGGLLAVLAAAALPEAWRQGPLTGAMSVSAAAVLLVAEPVVAGVLGPLTWPADPWSLPAGRTAREALGSGLAWGGTVAAPVALLGAALAVAAAGIALGRRRMAAVPVGVLATSAAVLLPLGLDLPYAVALAVSLATGGALVAGGIGLRDRSRTGAPALALAGGAVLLHATAWATASQAATLAVLPVAALLAAAVAATRLPLPAGATALAGLLAAAELGAVGAARDLSSDQVGALLVVAVAALLGAATLLDRARTPGAELAAGLTAAVAVVLAAVDPGWLSWTLVGLGLLALASALRPDRRVLAPAGALLLTASSWVRLADAGVEAPEPYVLPVAALALLLGHLRRREQPSTRSWAAYGPGLVLALGPSLLASTDDEALTRPLLLGLAALGVLLLGARSRLQAPLAVGGTVLALDALQLLGPYAAALPRWLSLGAAGTLLLVVGATYEQRRQDVARLRDRFDALG